MTRHDRIAEVMIGVIDLDDLRHASPPIREWTYRHAFTQLWTRIFGLAPAQLILRRRYGNDVANFGPFRAPHEMRIRVVSYLAAILPCWWLSGKAWTHVSRKLNLGQSGDSSADMG